MDKVFLDTDVILDLLLDREPFAYEAARIFSLCDKKKIAACTTGLVFANAYYVLRKLSTHRKVTEKLLLLTQWVEIIPLSKQSVVTALQSAFSDFEDALQHFSAVESNIQIIITRNIKDYKKSVVSVLTPSMYLRGV